MAAKILVVANWKMNPSSLKEAKKLFEATKKAAARSRKVSVVVAPPAVFLRELHKARGRLALAAQNAHFESAGHYTGELSMAQVRDAGAAYVLIGHAERRQMGETNEDTRKKIAAALRVKLFPIFCVGESKRGAGGEHFDVVRSQLRSGFGDVPLAALQRVIIVYEPLWTIGTDHTMAPRDMHEMSIFIRKCLGEMYLPAPQRSARQAGGALNSRAVPPVLYGGSVDEKNVLPMLREGEVKGFLVGRASVDIPHMQALLETISSSR